MPAAAKMKLMKINSFTLPFLRLLATRYQQGEEKTATQKMTVKMFENE